MNTNIKDYRGDALNKHQEQSANGKQILNGAKKTLKSKVQTLKNE